MEEKVIRLNQFLEHEHVTQSRLAEELNTSQPTISSILSGRRSLSRGMVARLCALFPHLNRSWLESGEGNMLNDSSYAVDEIEIPTEEELNALSRMKVHVVPLIPTAALANSLSEYFGPGVRRIDCQNIVSPVPGAEFAITISGDSMEPKFHDGMIIFLKRINDQAFIPWGNTLVLDTENGAFIKDVFPCEDNEGMIEARSINPHYPMMRIPKTSIFGMYRVLNATKFYTTM